MVNMAFFFFQTDEILSSFPHSPELCQDPENM